MYARRLWPVLALSEAFAQMEEGCQAVKKNLGCFEGRLEHLSETDILHALLGCISELYHVNSVRVSLEFNPNLKRRAGVLPPCRLVRILEAKFNSNDETRLRLPFYFLFGTSPYLKKSLDDDNTGIFIRWRWDLFSTCFQMASDALIITLLAYSITQLCNSLLSNAMVPAHHNSKESIKSLSLEDQLPSLQEKLAQTLHYA